MSKNHRTAEPAFEEADELEQLILGLIPQSIRQNSLGARDCLRRFAKLHDELLTENHLLRHGHKESDFVVVLKMAYRKHVLGDEDIGWNQLGDRLCDALCNAIGNKGFRAWLTEQRASRDSERSEG